MRISLVRRAEPAQSMMWLSPVLAAVLSAIAMGILFALLGRAPLAALNVLFISPLSSVDNLAELGLKATPLLLCAIGIAVGVRAQVWNIGAEGQFTMGAIAAGGIALWLGGGDHWWVLPLMFLAGIDADLRGPAVLEFFGARAVAGSAGDEFSADTAIRRRCHAADADRGYQTACRRPVRPVGGTARLGAAGPHADGVPDPRGGDGPCCRPLCRVF
jgi:hypothetical protein